MSPFAVTVDGGASGEAVAMAGEILSLVLDKAFAPGQPLRFTVAMGGRTEQLAAKALGSKRRSDDRFDVRVRLVNLRKTVREALAELNGL